VQRLNEFDSLVERNATGRVLGRDGSLSRSAGWLRLGKKSARIRTDRPELPRVIGRLAGARIVWHRPILRSQFRRRWPSAKTEDSRFLSSAALSFLPGIGIMKRSSSSPGLVGKKSASTPDPVYLPWFHPPLAAADCSLRRGNRPCLLARCCEASSAASGDIVRVR